MTDFGFVNFLFLAKSYVVYISLIVLTDRQPYIESFFRVQHFSQLFKFGLIFIYICMYVTTWEVQYNTTSRISYQWDFEESHDT